MAQNFGVGFIIGATVAASVNSAFTTVSNKIKQTQAQMGKTRQEMSTLNKAITLNEQRSSLLAQYRASGGPTPRFTLSCKKYRQPMSKPGRKRSGMALRLRNGRQNTRKLQLRWKP